MVDRGLSHGLFSGGLGETALTHGNPKQAQGIQLKIRAVHAIT